MAGQWENPRRPNILRYCEAQIPKIQATSTLKKSTKASSSWYWYINKTPLCRSQGIWGWLVATWNLSISLLRLSWDDFIHGMLHLCRESHKSLRAWKKHLRFCLPRIHDTFKEHKRTITQSVEFRSKYGAAALPNQRFHSPKFLPGFDLWLYHGTTAVLLKICAEFLWCLLLEGIWEGWVWGQTSHNGLSLSLVVSQNRWPQEPWVFGFPIEINHFYPCLPKIFVIPKFAKQLELNLCPWFPWKESFSFAAMLGDSLSSVVNCDFGDFGHSCWVETGQLQYAVFNAGNKKHCKFHQVSMRTLHSVSRESLDFVKSQEFGAGWLQHRAPLPFIPVTDIGWSLTPRSELSPTSGIGLGGQGWYSPQVIWPSTCSFFGRRFCSSDYANWLLVFMNLPYEIG